MRKNLRKHLLETIERTELKFGTEQIRKMSGLYIYVSYA